MTDARLTVPQPRNEPIRQYRPGSPQRAALETALKDMLAAEIEIPLRIAGQRVASGQLGVARAPHEHARVLARFHCASTQDTGKAIAAAGAAFDNWSQLPWEARAAVFLKAADLLSGPWRDRMNAATMLGQSKTCFQSEIDAACEMADFWRFNVHYMTELYSQQPDSAPGMWNYVEYRPLDGFVFAATPFNFTSIGGNLPTAPALLGNTVIWKPSERAVLSAHVTMELLEEAGLPPGVINFLPADPPNAVGDPVLASPELAGVHFTGSTRTFQWMWQQIGANVERYRSYPRIVGETGGKDFVFAHPSADLDALTTALVRGAFEYQGQKCSAASRAFIPASLYDELLARLEGQIAQVRVGSPLDFSNFMCAVIDERAFATITDFIEYARSDAEHEIVIGGASSDEEGYFIQPTVVVAAHPRTRLMTQEIFGPVLTLCRYDDARMDEAMSACDEASPYALTGAIFAQDRAAIVHMSAALRHSAGNFYINDKPTGAVVGQQPFGGGRASGTNDKAGSLLNLVRWVSPRTVKETFVPATDFRYPHMG